MYSSHYLNKKSNISPYVITLGLVILIVSFTFLLYKTITNSSLKVDNVGKDSLVYISNISSNSVSLIWESISLEKTKLSLMRVDKKINEYFDDRDLKNFQKKRKYHYVTMNNLLANTEYYAIIYLSDSDKKTLSFKTKSQTNIIEKPMITYGKLNDQYSEDGSIILLLFDNYSIISTVSSLSREWFLSTNTIKSQNTINHQLSKEDTGKLIILDEKLGKTIKSMKYSDYLNEYMLATTLKSQGEIAGEKTDSTIKSKFNSLEQNNISINMPVEGALIDGSKPIFKGTAKSGQKIKVTIKPGEGNSYELYADNKGNWSYIPYFGLQNGKYVFEVFFYDVNLPISSKRINFTIIKNGESVLGEATGEARLTITLTPTQPSVAVNVTPTIVVEPSLTVEPIPSPTSIIVNTPVLTSEPVSGLDIRLFSFISMFFIISGSILFLLL